MLVLDSGLFVLPGILQEVHMHASNVVVERDAETEPHLGSVPGWPGSHRRGPTRDESQASLQEVIEMLLDDGEPRIESEFVGIQTVRVT